MYKKVFSIITASIVTFGLILSLMPGDVLANRVIGGGGGGGTPTPTACVPYGACGGSVCSTNTHCSSGGYCVSNSGCNPAGYTKNGCTAIWTATCPTPTPPPPPPKTTISADPTFYDISTEQGLAVGSRSGYLGDQISATVNTSYASSVSVTMVQTDNIDGQSSTTHPSVSQSGSSWSVTFNLDPFPSPQSSEVYGWKLTFYASGNSSTQSNSDSIYMVYPYTQPFQCDSLASGKLLASNIDSPNQLTMFNNDNSNPCQSSYYFNGGAGQSINLPIGAINYSQYNSDAKDSILFFPTGAVTDSQCYPGGKPYDETSQTVITSGLTSGNVWLVHWCYKQSNVYNTIDTSTIRAILLITGTPGNAVDMEIDSLNGPNSPKYFWYSRQITSTYRIDWSKVYGIYNAWRSTGFTNAPQGPIDINNCYASTSVGSQPCLFQDGTSMNGYYSNGIKTSGNSYLSIIQNSDQTRHVNVYNPNGASKEGYSKSLNTGINNSGFSVPGYSFLQNNYWHMDGMTTSDDNNYLFVASGAGRLIFVYNISNPSNPYYVGLVPIVGPPDSTTNGGFDGIEVDPNGQLYIADETQGVWSANSQDIINAAWQNGGNLRARNWVQASLYVNTPSGVNFDDIAPLSGAGASSYPKSAYYATDAGNSYSDGGFNLTLNAISDPANQSFTTYGLLSNGSSDLFANSRDFSGASSNSGSWYNWNFSKYKSSLNANNSTPEYGYQNVYTILNNSQNNIQTPFNSSIINSSTSMPGGDNNGKHIFYTHTGDMTIDGSSTINANGILLVNGNVNITSNPFNQFNTSGKHLMVFASGNITINTPSYYTNSPSSFMYQNVDLGMVADGNITINNYPDGSVDPSNFVEPLIINGIMIDYGKGNSDGTASTNFLLDIGYLDQWYPAVRVNYDNSFINTLSQLFTADNTTQEIGL